MDIFLRSKEGKKEYFPKENSIYLERESLWRTKLPQVCHFLRRLQLHCGDLPGSIQWWGEATGESKGAEQGDLKLKKKKKQLESRMTSLLSMKRHPKPSRQNTDVNNEDLLWFGPQAPNPLVGKILKEKRKPFLLSKEGSFKKMHFPQNKIWLKMWWSD